MAPNKIIKTVVAAALVVLALLSFYSLQRAWRAPSISPAQQADLDLLILKAEGNLLEFRVKNFGFHIFVNRFFPGFFEVPEVDLKSSALVLDEGRYGALSAAASRDLYEKWAYLNVIEEVLTRVQREGGTGRQRCLWTAFAALCVLVVGGVVAACFSVARAARSFAWKKGKDNNGSGDKDSTSESPTPDGQHSSGDSSSESSPEFPTIVESSSDSPASSSSKSPTALTPTPDGHDSSADSSSESSPVPTIVESSSDSPASSDLEDDEAFAKQMSKVMDFVIQENRPGAKKRLQPVVQPVVLPSAPIVSLPLHVAREDRRRFFQRASKAAEKFGVKLIRPPSGNLVAPFLVKGMQEAARAFIDHMVDHLRSRPLRMPVHIPEEIRPLMTSKPAPGVWLKMPSPEGPQMQ